MGHGQSPRLEILRNRAQEERRFINASVLSSSLTFDVLASCPILLYLVQSEQQSISHYLPPSLPHFLGFVLAVFSFWNAILPLRSLGMVTFGNPC